MADALAKLRDRRPDWEKAIAPRKPTRACGDCDVCCVVEDIAELNKPAQWPCAHMKAPPHHGCAIWGQPGRPKACSVFMCLWRVSDDLLPERLFPARSGFIMQVSPVRSFPLAVTVAPAPGRGSPWDTAEDREVFKALAAAWNCAVVCLDDRHAPVVAFAPMGGEYTPAARPDVFPAGHVRLYEDDYLPDMRPPIERIREQAARLRLGAG